jgi:hypothetical protein
MLRFSSFLLLCTAIGFLPAEGPAQTLSSPQPPSISAAPALTAAEAAELAALTGWQHTAVLRGSVGVRDNVLLSPFAPIGRSFARGELEVFLLQPEARGWDLLAFLNGDVTRYFSAPTETGGEQQWFLHGEARRQLRPSLRLALKADFFLQDSVIDLSEVASRREFLPTRAQGLFGTLAPRWDLPRGFALEAWGQARVTDYRDIASDYTESRVGARLEWKQSDRLGVSLSASQRLRLFRQRSEFTAGGRALPGTRLRFEQRDVELKQTSSWKRGKVRWSPGLTLGWMSNADGASGYFDYNQKRARLEMTAETSALKATWEAHAKQMDFRVQTVGVGIAPPARREENFETVLRVEHRWRAELTLFAEHRWERNRSNQPEFNYRANTVLAGLERAF